MPRQYTKTEQLSDEIFRLKAEGKTHPYTRRERRKPCANSSAKFLTMMKRPRCVVRYDIALSVFLIDEPRCEQFLLLCDFVALDLS